MEDAVIHRCATCPFWKELTNPDWGECQKMTSFHGNTPQRGTLAVAKHQSDNERAWVDVSKAFGCIMHPMNKATA